MKQYLSLASKIITNGRYVNDRTGTGCYRVFGEQMRFNLQEGFPLLTTKKLHLKSIIHELIWFLSGSTNIRYLKDNGVSIWDEWADENGELGPGVYGAMWRHWPDTRLIPFEVHKTSGHRPMTFVELIASIHKALPNLPENFIVVFKKDENGNATDEVIPPEEVEIGSDVYKEISTMADLLAERHDCIIDKYVAIPQDTMLDKFHDRGGFEYNGDVVKDGEICGHIVTRQIDQIKNLIDGLKKNPLGRRHIVSAWNPALVEETALPPCHSLFQFNADELTQAEIAEWVHINLPEEYDKIQDILQQEIKEGKFRDPNAEPGYISDFTCDAMIARTGELFSKVEGVPKHRLSCHLYQRSCDVGLGVPFNIASYSLLTMMVAQCVNMVPGDFVWTGGDVHIYKNHIEQLELQLTRDVRKLPTMKINPFVTEIDQFKFEDFSLEGYDPHPSIKMDVSV